MFYICLVICTALWYVIMFDYESDDVTSFVTGDFQVY